MIASCSDARRRLGLGLGAATSESRLGVGVDDPLVANGTELRLDTVGDSDMPVLPDKTPTVCVTGTLPRRPLEGVPAACPSPAMAIAVTVRVVPASEVGSEHGVVPLSA